MDRIILDVSTKRKKGGGMRFDRKERGGTSWSCVVTECPGDVLT